jgi:opacity protein-like surface antigen
MLRKLFTAAAMIGATLASTEPAAAQVKPGWYGQVAVGGLWFQDTDGTVSGIDVTGEYDTGYALWAAGGYRFSNGFRTELELGYGRTSLDKVKALGVTATVDSDIDLYSATANLFYDINTGTFATPYLGGGIGVLHSRSDGGTVTVGATTVAFDGDSSTDPTAFGEVGVGLRVSDGMEIVPSYRYQWVGNGSDGFDDDTAQVARIGLRFGF